MYSPGRVEHDMARLADHWRECYVWEKGMSMQAAALAQTRREEFLNPQSDYEIRQA